MKRKRLIPMLLGFAVMSSNVFAADVVKNTDGLAWTNVAQTITIQGNEEQRQTGVDGITQYPQSGVATTTITQSRGITSYPGGGSVSGGKCIINHAGAMKISDAFKVKANGTYTASVTDQAANTTTTEVTISNIDKTAPTATLTNITSWNKTKATLRLAMSDSGDAVSYYVPAATSRASGLAKYNVIRGGTTIKTEAFTTLPLNSTRQGPLSKTVTFDVTANGTYTAEVRDAAGNIKTVTVDVNTIDSVSPTGSITRASSGYTNLAQYTLNASDDRSGIASVKMSNPGGVEIVLSPVSPGVYTFTGTQNGDYTCTITDNAGNVGTATFTEDKVDTVAATISFTQAVPAGTWTKDAYDVTISAVDDASGVQRLEIVDSVAGSNTITGDTHTYEINSNRTITVTCYDVAGNSSVETLTVSNIDTTQVSITTSGNPTSWVHDGTLTVDLSDAQSGISDITVNGTAQTITGNPTTKQITVPITQNGDIVIVAHDAVGNESTQTVTVTFVDFEGPTGSVAGNPTDWVNTDVTLTITAEDNQSGVKSITKPDGTVVTGNTCDQTVSVNGTYTFTVTDNVGNTTTYDIDVTKIDKVAPELEITEE